MTPTPPKPATATRKDLFRRFHSAYETFRIVDGHLRIWASMTTRFTPEEVTEHGQRTLEPIDQVLDGLQGVRDQLAHTLGHDLAGGVTAGYDPESDAWRVEIHQPGQPVEDIPIAAPQAPDEETARALAEQIAENRGLPYMEQNRGCLPADHVLDQVRQAAWMQGEDDPSLVAEIVRLRQLEQQSVELGWSQVEAPKVVGHARDGIQFHVEGLLHVVAAAGIVAAGTTGPITCDPDLARKLGAALVTAAQEAERLQRERNEANALSTADTDQATS